MKIDISLPKCWEDLTEENLLFMSDLFSRNISQVEFLTRCLLNFTGWKLLKKTHESGNYILEQEGNKFLLGADMINTLCNNLHWITTKTGVCLNLSRIGKYRGCQKDLYDVSLERYLLADNFFTAFVKSKKEEYLFNFAAVLYLKKNKSYNEDMVSKNAPYFSSYPKELNILTWWYCGVKVTLKKKFPALFVKGEESTQSPEESVRSIISALNGGDITKNEQIYKSNCLEALCQLNNLAEQASKIKNDV